MRSLSHRRRSGSGYTSLRFIAGNRSPLGDRLFTYPEFDPVALSIGPLFGYGPLEVRWYGLMYLVGFVGGWLGARARAKQPWSRIKPEQVDDIVFYVALGAIVGGRVGYMLIYGLSELLADPLELVQGVAGRHVVPRRLRRRARRDVALRPRTSSSRSSSSRISSRRGRRSGLFAGRVGNFINGELWGKPTSPDAPWAVIVDGQARHASQLYEAFLEGVVLFLVLWLYSRKPRPVMATSALFLIVYGVGRFLVEFVRVPDQQIGYLALGWVTMGQVLSAPMIIVGVILFVLAHRRRTAA